MKRYIILFTFILILSIAVPATLASAGVTADKTTTYPGESVLISGTACADESVIIKITDEAGNIVFFDAAKVDADGKYSVSFVVSSDMAAGRLTIMAGSGNDVAATTITVKSRPTPATTAPTATAAPSATTTAGSSPSDGDKPADTPESAPAPSGDAQKTIIPKEISRDEETGVITIVIDVADLPQGTAAIETPDGQILYVADAKDGTLVFEVTEDDVTSWDGDIEIVALDDEITPLATIHIRVLDENQEIVIAQTDNSHSNEWMIVIYIAAGLVMLAVIMWILMKRRNKGTKDDNGAAL